MLATSAHADHFFNWTLFNTFHFFSTKTNCSHWNSIQPFQVETGSTKFNHCVTKSRIPANLLSLVDVVLGSGAAVFVHCNIAVLVVITSNHSMASAVDWRSIWPQTRCIGRSCSDIGNDEMANWYFATPFDRSNCRKANKWCKWHAARPKRQMHQLTTVRDNTQPNNDGPKWNPTMLTLSEAKNQCLFAHQTTCILRTIWPNNVANAPFCHVQFPLSVHKVQKEVWKLACFDTRRKSALHCAKSHRPFELFANENCKLRNEPKFERASAQDLLAQSSLCWDEWDFCVKSRRASCAVCYDLSCDDSSCWNDPEQNVFNSHVSWHNGPKDIAVARHRPASLPMVCCSTWVNLAKRSSNMAKSCSAKANLPIDFQACRTAHDARFDRWRCRFWSFATRQQMSPFLLNFYVWSCIDGVFNQNSTITGTQMQNACHEWVGLVQTHNWGTKSWTGLQKVRKLSIGMTTLSKTTRNHKCHWRFLQTIFKQKDQLSSDFFDVACLFVQGHNLSKLNKILLQCQGSQMTIDDNKVLPKMQLTSEIAQPCFFTQNMHWLELSTSPRSHVIGRNLTTVPFPLACFLGWVRFLIQIGGDGPWLSSFLWLQKFTIPLHPANAHMHWWARWTTLLDFG